MVDGAWGRVCELLQKKTSLARKIKGSGGKNTVLASIWLIYL